MTIYLRWLSLFVNRSRKGAYPVKKTFTGSQKYRSSYLGWIRSERKGPYLKFIYIGYSFYKGDLNKKILVIVDFDHLKGYFG